MYLTPVNLVKSYEPFNFTTQNIENSHMFELFSLLKSKFQNIKNACLRVTHRVKTLSVTNISVKQWCFSKGNVKCHPTLQDGDKIVQKSVSKNSEFFKIVDFWWFRRIFEGTSLWFLKSEVREKKEFLSILEGTVTFSVSKCVSGGRDLFLDKNLVSSAMVPVF